MALGTGGRKLVVLLAALLLGWALVRVLSDSAPSRPVVARQEQGVEGEPSRRRFGSQPRKRGANAAADPVALDTELLDRLPEMIEKGGRNVFQFAPTPAERAAAIEEAQKKFLIENPPPPPIKSPEQIEQERVAAENLARMERDRQEQERRRQTCTSATLKYIGSFGPTNAELAVFSDGEDLYNVRVGDRVGTHFLLKAIGLESVDLECVDYPEQPPQRLAIGP